MIKKFYDSGNSLHDIAMVVDLLNDGGLLVFPTDTVYAIGCHALKERAVERVCQIKGLNPAKNNLSVICYDLKHISEYAKVSNAAFKLMKNNLPGPFTFVLPAGHRLPKIYRSRKEVGIRVPDNEIIREICLHLEAPILTTTIPYDEHDEVEYMTNPELIHERLGQVADLVIDGGIGGFVPSTVVALRDDGFEVIRDGKGVLKF